MHPPATPEDGRSAEWGIRPGRIPFDRIPLEGGPVVRPPGDDRRVGPLTVKWSGASRGIRIITDYPGMGHRG